MLVTFAWIKYIRNIDLQFVHYLCIMDLVTMKQTHMHVSSAFVSMFVMRLWVCRRIQVQLKSLNERQLFSSTYWLMICEVSDCSLVNCNQGRRLRVASGVCRPRPRSWGGPALQASEFLKLYSPVNWKCWYILRLKSFKVKFRSVVLGCLLYQNRLHVAPNGTPVARP